jgi:hypothetical protein
LLVAYGLDAADTMADCGRFLEDDFGMVHNRLALSTRSRR